MMSELLAFFGLGRCGKDTMADLFVEHHGYTKLSFATPLYQEVADAFDVDVAQLHSDEWKTKPQAALQARFTNAPGFKAAVERAGLFLDEYLTSRRALQIWANDYMKATHGQDYYAAKMIGQMRAHGGKSIVIPDLRHDIEACVGHWCVSRRKHNSFKIIEILRHGTQNTGHTSDNGLSKFLIDGTVRNNTTVEECYDQILNVLKQGQEVRTHG